jgi:hypothetical protein
LFWDAANARLGIGMNTPASSIDILINNSSPAYNSLNVKNTNTSGKSSAFFLNNNNEGGSFATYGTTFGAVTFRNNFAVSGTKSVIFLTDGNLATGGTSPILFIIGGYDNTPQMTLNGSGRLLLGTTTDGGQRLQVQGDAYIRGSGATSATSALSIQDSAGTAMLTVRNDGVIRVQKSYINLSSDANNGIGASNDGSNFVSSGGGILYATGNRTSSGVGHAFYGGNITHTSGEFSHLRTTGRPNFAPTSGTGTFSIAFLESTINQTGGANGITRGLYVNPTLTAAADWRSIEWSNNSGWGLYGAGTSNNYLGGRLGIGTTSPAYNLDVRSNVNGVEGIVIANSNTGTGAATAFQIGQTPTSSPYNAMYITNYGSGWTGGGGAANSNRLTSGSGSTGGFDISVEGLNAPFRLFTNGGSSSEKMRISANGALGLRSTIPSTLSSTNAFTFIGQAGAISSATVANDLTLLNNGYFNGTNNVYKNNGISSALAFDDSGNIILLNAPSGTAGGTITYSERMRLTAAGRLLFGTTTESTFLLDVNGTARVSGTLTLTPASSDNAIVINSGGYIKYGTSVYVRGFSTTYSILDSSFNSKFVLNWGGASSFFLTGGNYIFNGSTANASAMVQIDSTTSGFLPPRMTTTQKNAISSPAAGLQVYDTTLNQMSYYNGTTWVNF